MKFLHMVNVSYDWHVGCIHSCGWVNGLSENLHVELLCFIIENWNPWLSSHLQNVPFLKYVNLSNITTLESVSNDELRTRIYFSSELHILCLLKWCGDYSMPKSTQKAIIDLDGNKGVKLHKSLKEYPKITQLSIASFAKELQ